MLYETARSAELLGPDVEDLDLPNRRARVRRKGGAIDIIVLQTGAARLMPRLLESRASGPVFLTDRRARVPLPPGDVDQATVRARMSYTHAEALFKAASGGATLRQLRHSAPTHDIEDGTSTPMLATRSRHTSVRSGPVRLGVRRGPAAAPGRTRPCTPEAVMITWRTGSTCW
jgi:integrase